MQVSEAHALYIDMFAQHDILDWKIRWNREAGTAGTTSYKTKTVTFSALAVERWKDDDVIALGLHEIAHVLVGPGHEHDKVWAKQVRSLGGVPEENCPRFSSNIESVFTDMVSADNAFFLVLVLVGTFFVAPPVAVILAGIIVVWGAIQNVRNARALPDEVRERIERNVLNP